MEEGLKHENSQGVETEILMKTQSEPEDVEAVEVEGLSSFHILGFLSWADCCSHLHWNLQLLLLLPQSRLLLRS